MDAFHTVHVSLSGGAESGHCHDSGGDIEASDLNDPLKSSNQGLIYLDASMSSRSDVSSSGWSPLAREDAFLGVCPKIRLKFLSHLLNVRVQMSILVPKKSQPK
jgi:hypothetical protein